MFNIGIIQPFAVNTSIKDFNAIKHLLLSLQFC
jgi:hypothetical protein